MIHLRPLREDDLTLCHDIDRRVSNHPWPLDIFRRGLQKNHWARVAVDEADRPYAFCICLLVADELSVLNIAVDQSRQRQGVARHMITAALEAGRAHGADQAFLEVRQSNLPAQALYASMDFNVAGVRENYYPARAACRSDSITEGSPPMRGREHALIMARTLL
ncbi:MAG: ribosomal protein S18-alanine N-acetyltransferase [Natronospirillum sp.]|uniref:ribosomal protein S18-alanine N-acetyltransferase n=1 Tax=Natronospirillum sp. TaxID=2812955 RepID=UPI0025DF74A6|nr:ribosomal protein S18-alanine N-acetyltransferase [Natronospirillum sp.]MCH8551314.1 ribosomal protein S18-alanine N-acetyltransferase [Natronospirillum sp.]